MGNVDNPMSEVPDSNTSGHGESEEMTLVLKISDLISSNIHERLYNIRFNREAELDINSVL